VISPKTARAFRSSLLRWYARHRRDLPWRRTRDPYAVLVSEFMLQQTQVATVLPYYNKWLERFPDFGALARARQSQVLRAWECLGYYARARNLHATAKLVKTRYRGTFPHNLAEMRALPGIGRYTANAVTSFAFDQSVAVVEANVARVIARVFDERQSIDLAAGQEKIWHLASDLLPRRSSADHNSALMDLGALICTPRKPKCGICPVNKFCRATSPERLPIKRLGPRTKQVIETHAFVVRQSKILLQQSTKRWRGMWILPRLKTRSTAGAPVHMSIFPFTHHRVSLQIFSQELQTIDQRSQRWFSIHALDSIPIPSPHRRAISAILH